MGNSGPQRSRGGVFQALVGTVGKPMEPWRSRKAGVVFPRFPAARQFPQLSSCPGLSVAGFFPLLTFIESIALAPDEGHLRGVQKAVEQGRSGCRVSSQHRPPNGPADGSSSGSWRSSDSADAGSRAAGPGVASARRRSTVRRTPMGESSLDSLLQRDIGDLRHAGQAQMTEFAFQFR